MNKRRRIKQTMSLAERLQEFANHARERALLLAQDDERREILDQVEAAERAIQFERLLSSRS